MGGGGGELGLLSKSGKWEEDGARASANNKRLINFARPSRSFFEYSFFDVF